MRGLNTKTHDILNASYICQYEILALTETWIGPHIADSEIICDSYNTFRSDRNFSESSTKRGGGVLLAIKKEYTAVQLDLGDIRHTVPLIDVVGVELLIHFHKIFIFVVYIPPAMSPDYYSLFFEAIESLQYLNNYCDIVFYR